MKTRYEYLDVETLKNKLENLSNYRNTYSVWDSGLFITCTHYYGPARKNIIEAKGKFNKHITEKELKRILIQLRKAIKEYKEAGFFGEDITVDLETGWWE